MRVPKARSRSGSPEPFRSSVVPPYVRRCASLDAAIPWLYLHGVSTGQMRQAVAALVGEQGARGLSANVVSRLKRSWDEEYRQWCRRRLDDDWVYLWVDGIYSGLRGERERLCVLVVIGVNTRGDPRRGRPVPAFSDVPPVRRISRARPIPPGPADKDTCGMMRHCTPTASRGLQLCTPTARFPWRGQASRLVSLPSQMTLSSHILAPAGVGPKLGGKERPPSSRMRPLLSTAPSSNSRIRHTTPASTSVQ